MTLSDVPDPPTRPLTSFSVLTLDIYGTLIDWEKGIVDALEPLISRVPATHPLKSSSDPEETRISVGRAFNQVEAALQREKPHSKYSAILSEAYSRFALENGLAPGAGSEGDAQSLQQESVAFGASIASWPAFPDTVDAMNRLHKHFKLVPLSNVDLDSFRGTCKGPLKEIDPSFDAVYTAENIGSYKPSLRNFDYLLDHIKQDLGFEKDQILHTAQSLTHDHEPAKQMGLVSAWIARGPGGRSGMGGDVESMIKEGRVGFSWRFSSLGEMADAVEREIKERQ